MHRNYFQKGGGAKRPLERLLILLMMSCPFKSHHLHPQMDEYGRGAPQGLRSSQPSCTSTGSYFLWNEAGQFALKVEFVDRGVGRVQCHIPHSYYCGGGLVGRYLWLVCCPLIAVAGETLWTQYLCFWINVLHVKAEPLTDRGQRSLLRMAVWLFSYIKSWHC